MLKRIAVSASTRAAKHRLASSDPRCRCHAKPPAAGGVCGRLKLRTASRPLSQTGAVDASDAAVLQQLTQALPGECMRNLLVPSFSLPATHLGSLSPGNISFAVAVVGAAAAYANRSPSPLDFVVSAFAFLDRADGSSTKCAAALRSKSAARRSHPSQAAFAA